MNWKQFFCWHIWQEFEKTYLRREWEFGYGFFKYYAVECGCVKCSKRKIIEKRFQVI